MATALAGGLAGLVLVVAPGAAQGDAGAWAQRVQVIHDAASGTVARVQLRAWSAEPVDALEFVFEPEPGSGFDPAAGEGAITGRGKLVWRVRGSASYDRRTIHSTYVGGLAAGRPHGKGRLEKRSGEVLEGEWVAGRLHGEGVLLEADGTRTEASFVAGRAEGEGRQTRPDGSIYRGRFHNGLRDGEATIRLPGGTTYASRWRAGVEISGQRPDAMADAMVGGLIRAQSGGGDAGKVELSVSVDQRMTRQADMQYTHAVYDDHIEIHPEDSDMVDAWLGKAKIASYNHLAMFGFVDWEETPSYLEVAMKTADNSRVRVEAFQLHFEDSQVYRKPFLTISEHRGCVGFRPTFSFLNNGWGPARDGRLSIEFYKPTDPGEEGARRFDVAVDDFDDGLEVSLRSVLDQAGVDTAALERARFTCASEQDLPQCRQRVLDTVDFGEIEPLLSEGYAIGVGYRGEFTYSWSDDRGNTYEMTEPVEAELQLAAIETEVMVAEHGSGWGDPPAALRYQEVRLPSDDQDYTVDLALRGNRNVSDLTARLKVFAGENSIHRFRAVATFADGSMRQSKPVHYYHVRPRDPGYVPGKPDNCYLDDAIFVPPE
ncbi:MAG: hypothetical protein M9895_09575 [Aquamicrobium sp.]|uniref:hypothetical protein n=1 Tax=Aquamicrobium sp. TaxID=1872579 RepID=UPI00349E82A5|nr:hypothetical protein [Aquamicrobium sp.]